MKVAPAGCVGTPAMTGSLAAWLGGYQVGLYLAAVAMTIGTMLLILLRVIVIHASVAVEPNLA